MSDRIFAVIWLLAVAFVAAVGWRIEAPFSYEPIGPRAYPLLLCALMAGCVVWLFAKPDAHADWPREALRAKVALLLGAVGAWALLFEPLGFIVSTAFASFAIGRLFGAARIPSAVCGVVSGVGLFFFFDKLLDVNLPLGRIFA